MSIFVVPQQSPFEEVLYPKDAHISHRFYCAYMSIFVAHKQSPFEEDWCSTGPEGYKMFADLCSIGQSTCGKMNFEEAEHRTGNV